MASAEPRKATKHPFDPMPWPALAHICVTCHRREEEHQTGQPSHTEGDAR